MPNRTLPSSPSEKDNSGLTLIELILVVLLVALISTLAAGRIDTLVQWRQEGDLRKLRATWEFLFSEAFARGESYRLIIDLDRNSYYVRREIPPEGTLVQQVDYLANLRTQGERERRAAVEEENLKSLEEEFREEDARQGGTLDVLFYRSLFSDPEGPVRLGRPLEFPNLAETRKLTDGISIRDVVLRGETITRGLAAIRFTPRGASDFAVVHIDTHDGVFTMVNDPASGKVRMLHGDRDFDWNPREAGVQ